MEHIIIAIVIQIAAYYLLKYYVVKPIYEFINIAKELSQGDGDLTKHIVVKQNNEIKIAANYINDFINNVKEIIVDIKALSINISENSTALKKITKELENTINSTDNEAKQISQISASLSEHLEQTEESIKSTTKALSQTSEFLQKFASQLKETIDEINIVNQKEQELNSTLNQLNSQTEEIKNVLRIINDITEQTELLALNAAIEAARAGEHGRGFAVVADEVRKLAEKSSQSLTDIERIVTNITKNIEIASNEINENTEKMNEVAEKNKNIQVDLEGILVMNNENMDYAKTVAENIKIMAKNSEELSEHATILTDISKQNLEIENNISSISQMLQQGAEKLKNIVSKFRT
jgi:methyl-accepting chemotaxis protein